MGRSEPKHAGPLAVRSPAPTLSGPRHKTYPPAISPDLWLRCCRIPLMGTSTPPNSRQAKFAVRYTRLKTSRARTRTSRATRTSCEARSVGLDRLPVRGGENLLFVGTGLGLCPWLPGDAFR